MSSAVEAPLELRTRAYDGFVAGRGSLIHDNDGVTDAPGGRDAHEAGQAIGSRRRGLTLVLMHEPD